MIPLIIHKKKELLAITLHLRLITPFHRNSLVETMPGTGQCSHSDYRARAALF